MQLSKTLAVALCAGLCFIILAGCEQEGPAEKTGKEIDKAAEKTGKEIDKAVEEAKKAVEDARDKLN